uniref:Alternative protein RAB20 n=1 Tax=Homo sapiens TaxID=9606 RepID=L8EAY4_HUMAN|nr:alternative protein RAB20 [Homo sapiens]
MMAGYEEEVNVCGLLSLCQRGGEVGNRNPLQSPICRVETPGALCPAAWHWSFAASHQRPPCPCRGRSLRLHLHL